MSRISRRRALLWALSMSVGCGGDSPVQPTFELEALFGDYALEVLTFDPRGSLLLVDVRARFGHSETLELLIAETRQAQLRFREGSGLRQTVSGSWTLTAAGIQVTFGDGAAAGRLLMPRVLELKADLSSATLTFSGTVETVSRTSLVALVPEWQEEQLLDPTPGELSVQYRKVAQ